MKVTLASLLKSASLFLQTDENDQSKNAFGVNFSINYGIDKMCFSPTVYEMIKRFEFVRLRHKLVTSEEEKNSDPEIIDEEESSPD